MQINKIRLDAAAAILTASGICGGVYVKDTNRAEIIKQELKNEIEVHDSFPSIYDYNIAEYREPIFKKADYWEAVADSVRNEWNKGGK